MTRHLPNPVFTLEHQVVSKEAAKMYMLYKKTYLETVAIDYAFDHTSVRSWAIQCSLESDVQVEGDVTNIDSAVALFDQWIDAELGQVAS